MAENFRVNEEEERQNIIDRYEQGREQVLANGECVDIVQFDG